MFNFRNTQHDKDFHYLLNCYTKYTSSEPTDEWISTSYIISGIGLTDTFLSSLVQDMALNYDSLIEKISILPSAQKNLCRYAIQLSYPGSEKISFNQVVKNIAQDDLKLLLSAVDTHYFHKQLS
ncbi:hypothetical protein [Kurthia sibirica]|uniref:Uncharacterized protein n=1 Tax=Kurthia sibirica TaxID=202750 RepID=A0A2U3AHU4_9BACL|nr:hypothetical protein [Kurthia sibirica]PWI24123.1 hypothetical protein DEX24_15120 [Kurthia sibirica]GEK35300.1 hypothetical protein KSI01_28330 [Kurthia sibirica]